MSPWAKLDGRVIVVAALLAYFAVLLGGHAATGASIQKIWRALGVLAIEPGFVDLHNLVQADQARDAGQDLNQPLASDPGKGYFNYPSIWLNVDRLGLNEHTLTAFAAGMAGIALLAILYVLGRLDLRAGWWAALFVISPSVMLGVERANIDLIIFSIVALALALRRFVPASTFILVVAALLKIFPAFGLLALLTPPWRRKLPWLAAAVALLLIAFWSMRGQFHRIAIGTPHMSVASYGAALLPLSLYRHHLHDGHAPLTIPLQLGADLLLLGVMALGARLRPTDFPKAVTLPGRDVFAFLLGAGIFLGTFGLGTHFDYRLIFLVFCLPLLLHLRAQTGRATRRWSIGTLLVTLLAANWSFFSDDVSKVHLALKEALSWGIVSGLSGVLAAFYLPIWRSWGALNSPRIK